MPTGKLTGRRREVYEFVISASRERGYPPTMREIASALGLASPSTVLHHLRVLEEQGYIEREPARNRALRASSWRSGETQGARLVPLVGRVAAGLPILAAENLEGYMPAVGRGRRGYRGGDDRGRGHGQADLPPGGSHRAARREPPL